MVGPDVRAGSSVDQLPGDPHPLAGPTHRALEQVADPQPASRFTGVDNLPLQRKGRGPGDDKQPIEAGERGRQVLDHAVGKDVVLCAAAEIIKR